MKWFKHQSDAHMNAKLQKILIKYGAQGYGLYWFCLECVAGNISDHKLTFELEHDAEILAHHLKMDSRMVEEIMKYMVSLGLFENRGGTITCLKMAKRMDQSMTSSPAMRKLISGMRSHDGIMISHDEVMTESRKPMQDKTRLDKTRLDKKKKREGATSRPKLFKPPTEQEVASYIREKQYRSVNAKTFVTFYESKGWMVGKNKMKDWRKAVSGWESRSAKDEPNRKDFSLGAI